MPSDFSLPGKRFQFPYRTTRGITLRINPFGALPQRVPQAFPETNPGSPHQIGNQGKSRNIPGRIPFHRGCAHIRQVAVTPLNGWLWLKAGSLVKYDNDPVENLKKADTAPEAAPVANF